MNQAENKSNEVKKPGLPLPYSLYILIVLILIFFAATAAVIYFTADFSSKIAQNNVVIHKLTEASAVLRDTERKLSDIYSDFKDSLNPDIEVPDTTIEKVLGVISENGESAYGSNQLLHSTIDSLRLALRTSLFDTPHSADSFSFYSDIEKTIKYCRDLDKIIWLHIAEVREAQFSISLRLENNLQVLSGIAVASCVFALLIVISYDRFRRNVNKQKEIEEELKKQQETYRNLVENMNEGLIITDLEDSIVFANPTIEKITGYKPDFLKGRIFHKTFTNSSDWQGFAERMSKRKDGLSEEYTQQLIRKDGSVAEVLIKGTPFKNHSGEITGTLGVMIDLSEKVNFEKQIAFHRDNLIAVIENTDNYIWAFNHNYELLVYNTAFKNEYERLFGGEVFPGMPVLNFVGPKLTRAWRIIAKKALSGESLKLDRFSREGDLGKTYHVALNPIRTEDGTVMGVVAFMSDISHIKKTESDLILAKEIAEQATKQKTAFLANMSHEIRTPLNGILGMANLVEESELTAEQRLYISAIKESGATLLALINDILDISKVEAGKIELVESDFDLFSVVEGLTEIFSVQAENKNISFYIDISENVPQFLFGDSLRLRQILTNCLSNAFKFTSQGFVELSIEKITTDDNRDCLSFKIIDTGKGMDEETRLSIFNEYYQGKANTQKVYGGTGLGLSIARNFTVLMGGEISVQSTENEGSTFAVTIPMKLSESRIESVPRQSSGDILVVTNNNRGGKILEKLLIFSGYNPIMVYNAANAIMQVNKYAGRGKLFRAVISNFNLPGYDGFELSKQIIDLLPSHPPLFLLIGRRKAAHIKRQLVKYPITVLPKPFYLLSLNLVEAVLNPAAEPEEKIEANSTSSTALKILIVDDNKINRTVLAGYLQKFGHKITHATDGSEAVEEFRNGGFDIILMDCQMPVLNGFEATGKIRKLEEKGKKRIPIIGVTANNSQQEREKCINSGMDDMLSKPFDIVELRKILELHTVVSNIEEYSDSGFRVENDRMIRLRESLDQETVDELLQLFVNDFQGYLAAVSERIARHEFEGLSEESHTIKSSCANLGADKLWKYVEKLEHECKTLPADEITLLFNKMADEFIYVKEKIRLYLSGKY